jgi:hypothetical protein
MLNEMVIFKIQDFRKQLTSKLQCLIEEFCFFTSYRRNATMTSSHRQHIIFLLYLFLFILILRKSMDFTYLFNYNWVSLYYIGNLPNKFVGYLYDIYPYAGFAVTKALSCPNHSGHRQQLAVILFQYFFNRFLRHSIYSATSISILCTGYKTYCNNYYKRSYSECLKQIRTPSENYLYLLKKVSLFRK